MLKPPLLRAIIKTYCGNKLQLLAVVLLCLHQLFSGSATFPLPAVPLLLDAAAPRQTGWMRGEAHGYRSEAETAGKQRTNTRIIFKQYLI